MNIRFFTFPTLLCAVVCLRAADPIRVTVVDPSKSPIAGAHVALREPVGVAAECVSDSSGACDIKASPSRQASLFITADGFESRSVPVVGRSYVIDLSIAPRKDAVQVLGST